MEENSGGAIVSLSPGDRWGQEWERVVLNSICPKGITPADAELFVRRCRHTGLDPLNGEAFCVPRKVNQGSRERPVYVTIFVFQPSEAGMLARAEKFQDYRGTQAMAVYADDSLVEIDAGEGVVKHKFNPTKRKGNLLGAWAKVTRDGKVPVVVWLELAGYVQATDQWRKIPGNMIEKCARVAVLRKAYPSTFGGLYIPEELGEDGQPRTEDSGEKVVEGQTQRTEQLTQRFRVVAPAKPEPALPETTETPALWFGPRKGVALAELDASTLSSALENADGYLARYADKWPDHENVKLAQKGRGWVLDELREREAELKAPRPAPPAVAPEPETAEQVPPEQGEIF